MTAELTPTIKAFLGFCTGTVQEEDIPAIKRLIRKYYADKKQALAEQALEEFTYTREDIWMHDPLK